jgi:hypothetical protein
VPILYRLSFRYSRQRAKCGLSLNHQNRKLRSAKRVIRRRRFALKNDLPELDVHLVLTGSVSNFLVNAGLYFGTEICRPKIGEKGVTRFLIHEPVFDNREEFRPLDHLIDKAVTTGAC